MSDNTNRNEIGLIAEEVENIIPEVVYRNSPDHQLPGIDYGKLTTVLIEAVKEQQKQIEDQAVQIERLTLQMESVLEQLEKLKNK